MLNSFLKHVHKQQLSEKAIDTCTHTTSNLIPPPYYSVYYTIGRIFAVALCRGGLSSNPFWIFNGRHQTRCGFLFLTPPSPNDSRIYFLYPVFFYYPLFFVHCLCVASFVTLPSPQCAPCFMERQPLDCLMTIAWRPSDIDPHCQRVLDDDDDRRGKGEQTKTKGMDMKTSAVGVV